MTLHCHSLTSMPHNPNLEMTPPSSSAKSTSIFQVAIPTPLRRLFDYLPPDSSPDSGDALIQVGMRVKVPFGNRHVIGIVIAAANETAVPLNKLRKISAVLDSSPCFNEKLFNTLLWAANYYQHPIGEVIQTALPKKLRQGSSIIESTKVWKPAAGLDEDQAIAELSRSPRQAALLQLLFKRGPLSADAIKSEGFDTALLVKLDSQALVAQEQLENAHPSRFDCEFSEERNLIELNTEQSHAVEQINSQDGFACFLLNGVTGSGKTEVYMRAMERCLQDGKQCLLMVPEIGLTPQTVARFETRFSCPVVVIHSNLSDGDRFNAWRAANQGSAGIVIGTRSAIFTPLANPGLIIVDEEHDASFKQQDGFRYSARDIAIKRAQDEDIVIILGSATPSLESFQNVSSDKYTQLHLTDRAGGANESPMNILDVSESELNHGFSEQLLFKIEQHIAAQNQVLVFINRRGYAPVLQCRNCAWIAECENCIAQLTVHSQPSNLRCHHCESVLPIPRKCPACHSTDLHTLGAGTQKIEQFLEQHFNDVEIVRIDRDSTRNRKSWQTLVDRIKSGEPCILLGTQMLAKGHHFPHVTLVAILDADLGLFSADFRGQEQMAQTIVQVAGRAGRADKPGEVVIQSRHASHPGLVGLTQSTYTEYATELLQERQLSDMPPFSHLSLIRVDGKQARTVYTLAQRIAETAQSLVTPAIELLGPVPAPMEKKAGRFRLQLFAKSMNRVALHGFLNQLCLALEQQKLPSNARWSLDIDPYDLI